MLHWHMTDTINIDNSEVIIDQYSSTPWLKMVVVVVVMVGHSQVVDDRRMMMNHHILVAAV